MHAPTYSTYMYACTHYTTHTYIHTTLHTHIHTTLHYTHIYTLHYTTHTYTHYTTQTHTYARPQTYYTDIHKQTYTLFPNIEIMPFLVKNTSS